ncbi:methyltransferase (plasmid) [Streptomyces sp. BI20]|uniref:methyltransferase n=1 Tax=Streptomyces sp. BI20 TaxID=3403460 RepID=UPI003C772238
MPDQKTDQEAVRRVVDVITGTWQAQALYAAVALDLPDHVAAGHVTDSALAAAAGAGEDGVRRLTRLLTALGVLEPAEAPGPDGPVHRLTPTGELLRTGVPRSLAAMVRIYGEEFHRAWGAVVPAIRTGESGFRHAFGQSLHEYLRDPEAGARFQRAMNAGNVFFPDVPAAFDFSGARTVVDVAGGSGMLLGTVLAARPEARGILVDQPHMIPVAVEHLDATVGPDRYEARAVDLFADEPGLPAGADVYLLSRVLQDWDDDRCVALLSRLRAALGDTGGRLLILERVVPEHGETLLPLLYDLHLLVAAGGRERDLAGYRAVLAAAGLRLESVHPLSLETSLLVAAAA